MESHSGVRQLDQFTPIVTLPAPAGVSVVSNQLAGAGARALAGFIDLIIQVITFAILAALAVEVMAGGLMKIFPALAG